MHYLSCKKFVHRDLAARNVLVAKDGICKVHQLGITVSPCMLYQSCVCVCVCVRVCACTHNM